MYKLHRILHGYDIDITVNNINHNGYSIENEIDCRKDGQWPWILS